MSATAKSASADSERSLLDLLPAADRERLLARCEPVEFRFGQVIVREGEEADAAYILMKGKARVLRRKEDGREVALGVLRKGDIFGEIALLERTRRTATVRASGDVRVMRLSRERFEQLAAEGTEVHTWLDNLARARLLFNFLRGSPAFARLPGPPTWDLLRALRPVDVAGGTVVLRQGAAPGPMYIVESGRLRAFVSPKPGVVKNVAFLGPGDVFGEASLLLSQPRTATVEAASACRLLALEADAFRALLQRWPEIRQAIEERVAALDDEHEANVPLDFAEETVGFDPRGAPLPPPEVGGEDEAGASAAADPFATPEGLFRKGKPPRRFPFVFQTDEMDCGAACLAMICRHFGKRVSLARIRLLANTATDGTSIRSLCAAATQLGLAARTAKVSPQNIDGMPLPAIVHWRGNHWVVAVDIRRDRVRIADPAVGDHWVSREEFDRSWTRYAALFDYTEAFAQAPEEKASFAWITAHLRPFRRLLATVLAIALVSTGLTFLLPVLSQVVVDRVVVEGVAEILGIAVAAMAVVFVLETIASTLQSYLLAFMAVRVDAGILDFLSRRLLALPMRYFLARRTGDIVRRLDGGRQIRGALVTSGVGGLLAIVQLAVALALMTAYSSTLTLVFLAVTPIYVVLMIVSVRVLRPLFSQLEERHGRHRSEQLDAIKGIEAVKAAAAESAFREKLLEQFMSVARQQLRADYFALAYQGAVGGVGFLSGLLFLWIGARQALDGHITLGGFVAFNSLVLMANAPLRTLLKIWDDWQYVRVLLDRLADVLEYEPEQGHDHSRLLPVRTLGGRVELRNVSFRFGGAGSPWIVHDIDLEVTPGKTVAIVGRSGSGKTTLVRLLSGLLEPTEGQILFDGVDSKALEHRELRRKIGFVLQDTHIFSGTILENVAFGAEVDVARVADVARAAAADEFIERLPLGYDTVIGESGVALSGGQRQRVAIARALYNDPAILILDEATSALDTESEQAVQESLRGQLGKRTTFVIAHRLTTIRDADEIIVLEKGEIVERGTHDELVARRGVYFYLVNRQVDA